MKASILVLAALVAAAGPLAATERRAAIDSGSIPGTVVDSSTGRPLQGGEVRLSQGNTLVATTTTDATGHFGLRRVPEGKYVVEVRYVGYKVVRSEVTVAEAPAN